MLIHTALSCPSPTEPEMQTVPVRPLAVVLLLLLALGGDPAAATSYRRLLLPELALVEQRLLSLLEDGRCRCSLQIGAAVGALVVLLVAPPLAQCVVVKLPQQRRVLSVSQYSQ